MPLPVRLLVLRINHRKPEKMILVNQQNFTTNLITELLTYMVSGLQRMALWAKALKLNQKVLCLNAT